MGNKRVINLDDTTQIVIEVGANESGAVIIASNPVSFLPPYTEPGTEQVRTEAYQAGFEAGRMDAYVEYTKNITELKTKAHEAYQKGLSDAWECARKITAEYDEGGLSISDLYKVFGTESAQTILRDNTVQEAIAKIAEYEQGKDCDERITALIQGLQDNFGYTVDEIAAVLEKIKGAE